MAENFWGQFERTRENFGFQDDLRKALKDVTVGEKRLRVLDYGAGPIPHVITQFSTIQRDQAETVAFDPGVRDVRKETVDGLSPIEWTSNPPVGPFGLAVCHFSVHHMEADPTAVVRALTQCQSKVICIADYDYSQAKIDEFRDSFISQLELRELNDVFNGDLNACFDYHRRLSELDIELAMTNNGLRIVKKGQGKGIAKI